MQPRLTFAACALAALGLIAGCSSSSSSSGATDSDSATSTTLDSAAYKPPVCTRAVESTKAAPVPGSNTDWDLTSFDGTKIRMHWMPAAGASKESPKPTLLMGPGWSLSGSVDDGGADDIGSKVFGGLGVHNLREDGYNVLTWDPRGFGKSDGEAEVDSPDYEGRDVQTMIDWVASQPGVQLDAPGDPRMGMLGGSYGGGIQFVTAAHDCRVDAIVPSIAWNSLGTSLYKADTVKAGWAGVLISVAPTAHLDPHIISANEQAKGSGVLSDEERDWFLARGPGDEVSKVRAPTLIVQGTADTLFTLNEGVTNYELLRKAGVPVSMYWFCGGHGPCLDKVGDSAVVPEATVAWLARWVKQDKSAPAVAGVSIIDQDGHRYAVNDYPVAQGTPLQASGSGTLKLIAAGGAGPLPPQPASSDFFVTLAGGIIPFRAENAVTIKVPAPAKPTLVLGAPQLTLRYKGTVTAGERPTRVFAQIIDDSTGLTVGNQITPIAVTLDGAEHEVKVPLEIVSLALRSDSKLSLQIVATTVAYAQPRLGGEVQVLSANLSLPVAAKLVPPAKP